MEMPFDWIGLDWIGIGLDNLSFLNLTNIMYRDTLTPLRRLKGERFRQPLPPQPPLTR